MKHPYTFPLKGLINGQFTKESKTPAVPSWKAHRGGHGDAEVYGVAIPKGFIVIDVDAHKDRSIDYFHELNSLAEEPIDWEAAWIQTTVSGGEHYLFRVPTDVEIYARCLMPNVDTRVGGKSYIATGWGYADDEWPVEEKFTTERPELPKKLLALLTSSTKSHKTAPVDFDRPLEIDFSLSEALKWIGRVNPKGISSYDSWLSFTMACKRLAVAKQMRDHPIWYDSIKHAWDCVCSDGDNYDELNNLYKWDAEEPKLADLHTIKRLALSDPGYWIQQELESGVPPEELRKDVLSVRINRNKKYKICKDYDLPYVQDFKDESESEIINKFERTVDGILNPKWVDTYIKNHKVCKEILDYIKNLYYVETRMKCSYYSFKTDTYIPAQAIRDKFSIYPIYTLEGKKVKLFDFIHNVIQFVHTFRYEPLKPRLFVEDNHVYLNSFRGVDHAEVDLDSEESESAIFRHERHINILFPDKEISEPFKYQLARIIQNKTKTGMAMLIQGAPGVGKTYFKTFFEALLGYRNVKAVDYKNIVDNKFNDWRVESLVNCLEEIKPEGRYTSYLADRLKEPITAEYLTVEAKFQNCMTMRNHANYIAFTNHKDAMSLEKFDRRWFIMECAQQTEEDAQAILDTYGKDYFQLLFNDLKEYADVLYHYYMQLELPEEEKNRTRAPKTIHKQNLIDNSLNQDDIEVDECLKTIACGDTLSVKCDGIFLNKRVINANALVRNYNETHKEISHKKMYSILRRLGWERVDGYKIKGSRCAIFHNKSFAEHWEEGVLIPANKYGRPPFWDESKLGKYGE